MDYMLERLGRTGQGLDWQWAHKIRHVGVLHSAVDRDIVKLAKVEYKRMLPQLLAKGAMLASYGKKLAVIIQDQLLAYVGRTGRMDIEVEKDAALVNLIFFSYKLRSLADANVYKLELNRIIHTSSKKLETALIAGLIGARMPPKEEFDRIVADKMIEVINSQK